MSEVFVKSSYTGQPWKIENHVKDFKFIADEKEYPNPVEYLTGAVNSCISISAAMIVNAYKLDVKNFHVENTATIVNLGHSKTEVSTMKISIYFDSPMSKEEKEDFLGHILHVSTVYQTLAKNIEIHVKIA